MTLQPLHSGFPYIRGKFSFLFYQCTVSIHYSLLKDEIVVGIKLSLPPSPFLSSAGICKQSMGAQVGIGLSHQTARLHRLAEFISSKRFLGSLKV
jgi:hypothetical protein